MEKKSKLSLSSERVRVALAAVGFFALTLAIAEPLAYNGSSAVVADSGTSKGEAGRWHKLAETLSDEGLANLAFASELRALTSEDGSLTNAASIRALANLESIQSTHRNLVLPALEKKLARLAAAASNDEDSTRIVRRYAYRALLGLLSRADQGAKGSEDALIAILNVSPAHAGAARALRASRDGNSPIVRAEAEAALTAIGKLTAKLGKDATPAELTQSIPELRLALARARYALGDADGARADYAALFKIGVPMQDALIESAWSELRMKHYGKAIGLSFELETGKLAQFFAPEASSVRAISFLENCRYSEARRSIERFSTRYEPLVGWLKSAAGDRSLYEMAIARAEGSVSDSSVPAPVWAMWSGSDLFNSLQASIKSSFTEERKAKDYLASEVSDVRVRRVLEADVREMVRARSVAAQMIEQRLAALDESLLARISRESERLKFVRIETNQGAGRDLIYLNAHPEIKKLENDLASREPTVKKPKGALRWGKVDLFDPKAETWTDEIGAYEGQGLNRCDLNKEIKAAQK